MHRVTYTQSQPFKKFWSFESFESFESFDSFGSFDSFDSFAPIMPIIRGYDRSSTREQRKIFLCTHQNSLDLDKRRE
jgi:hypothetical protein